MQEIAGGVGAAGDATVAATDGDPVDEERLALGRAQGRAAARADAEALVAAAEAKVERAREQLAAAEEALAVARATQEGLD